MARRSNPVLDIEAHRQIVAKFLDEFKVALDQPDLRPKVKALVPVFHALRDLGASLIPKSEAASARDRLLAYLGKYPMRVIDGDELLVVSGIGEWARRIRELRTQFGWWIYSGNTFKDIATDAEQETDLLSMAADLGVDPKSIKPDQYVLVSVEQDRDAAHRWNLLNEIRKKRVSVTEKIIEYLRANVGKPITGEELKYLAKDRSEWARRTREMRTEDGWPVKTKSSGRPDLPVGVYVLEADRQAPVHDRKIPDLVRVAVLTRDGYKCVNPACRWERSMASRDDPRTMLELHHLIPHAARGENTVKNLATFCNVCHDDIHRGEPVLNFVCEA
jgi:hypothetical protein